MQWFIKGKHHVCINSLPAKNWNRHWMTFMSLVPLPLSSRKLNKMATNPINGWPAHGKESTLDTHHVMQIPSLSFITPPAFKSHHITTWFMMSFSACDPDSHHNYLWWRLYADSFTMDPNQFNDNWTNSTHLAHYAPQNSKKQKCTETNSEPPAVSWGSSSSNTQTLYLDLTTLPMTRTNSVANSFMEAKPPTHNNDNSTQPIYMAWPQLISKCLLNVANMQMPWYTPWFIINPSTLRPPTKPSYFPAISSSPQFAPSQSQLFKAPDTSAFI